jgi:hypothetical protein
MNEIYEPDGKFVERLEWQLALECRRTSRLKSSAKMAISRRAVALTIVVGAVMTGVAMIKAADYIKDSWRKKIEIARAETDVKLKKAHLDLRRELASKAETQVSNGLIPQEEYLVMKHAAERSALALEESLLNLDEVKASGEVPRNELYAPVVGGRDFVSERLKLNQKVIESNVQLLRSRYEQRLKQKVEKGLAPGDQMDEFQATIAAREKMIDEIQNRLDLRKHFVAGDITAREVEVKDLITVAEGKLRQWQSTVDSMKKRLDRLQTLQAGGLTSKAEPEQLQFSLNAAQTELKLATMEIDILKKVK